MPTNLKAIIGIVASLSGILFVATFAASMIAWSHGTHLPVGLPTTTYTLAGIGVLSSVQMWCHARSERRADAREEHQADLVTELDLREARRVERILATVRQDPDDMYWRQITSSGTHGVVPIPRNGRRSDN